MPTLITGISQIRQRNEMKLIDKIVSKYVKKQGFAIQLTKLEAINLKVWLEEQIEKDNLPEEVVASKTCTITFYLKDED